MTDSRHDTTDGQSGHYRSRPDKESEFAEFLATYEQSVTGDLPTPIDVTNDISQLGLLHEFDQAKECIDLIGQIWPRCGAVPTENGEFNTTLPDQDPLRHVSEQASSHRRLGRFEIRRELGRGGGGIVYLAVDPKLNRYVALKVPHPESLYNPELRDRFLHEAQVAAGIDHPNIVPVYEIGEAGPICFIAAAYCVGPTLADWLQRQDQPRLRQSWSFWVN